MLTCWGILKSFDTFAKILHERTLKVVFYKTPFTFNLNSYISIHFPRGAIRRKHRENGEMSRNEKCVYVLKWQERSEREEKECFIYVARWKLILKFLSSYSQALGEQLRGWEMNELIEQKFNYNMSSWMRDGKEMIKDI